MASALYKFGNNVFVSLYRRTGGKIAGKTGVSGILLLTTTGRKSGLERTTPVGYFKDGEDHVITASNAGGQRNPDWYFNLKANPQALIEVGSQKIKVTAQQADPEQKKRLWAKLISVSPQYDRYSHQTSRDIPMMVLHPRE